MPENQHNTFEDPTHFADVKHMSSIERGEHEVGTYIQWKILHTLKI